MALVPKPTVREKAKRNLKRLGEEAGQRFEKGDPATQWEELDASNKLTKKTQDNGFREGWDKGRKKGAKR